METDYISITKYQTKHLFQRKIAQAHFSNKTIHKRKFVRSETIKQLMIMFKIRRFELCRIKTHSAIVSRCLDVSIWISMLLLSSSIRRFLMSICCLNASISFSRSWSISARLCWEEWACTSATGKQRIIMLWDYSLKKKKQKINLTELDRLASNLEKKNLTKQKTIYWTESIRK